MTTTDMIINAQDIAFSLSAIATIVFAAYLFFGPWQRYVVDATRQRLFEVRDEIFDLAAERRDRFDSAQYRFIRAYINGCIRFAHEADLPHLYSAVLAHRLAGNVSAKSVDEKIQAFLRDTDDEELQKAARRAMLHANLIIAWSMIRRSLVLVSMILVAAAFLLVPAIGVALIFGSVIKIARFCRQSAESVAANVERALLCELSDEVSIPGIPHRRLAHCK